MKDSEKFIDLSEEIRIRKLAFYEITLFIKEKPAEQDKTYEFDNERTTIAVSEHLITKDGVVNGAKLKEFQSKYELALESINYDDLKRKELNNMETNEDRISLEGLFRIGEILKQLS